MTSSARNARLAELRKIWLIPDAYPMIAALGVLAGLVTYFGYNKLCHDPTVVVSRKLRNAGFFAQFDSRPRDIGHLTGLAHASKAWSTRIFDKTEPNHIHELNTERYLESEHRRIHLAEAKAEREYNMR
mmetsp:Transcript_15314/g.41157  ORF Transcript_15314/g.41157 Transcript_15314/m.41157 type:complete len:129 (-) Transcript_15314:171-557(-)|eukprot:CAMPEP_0185837864 /NCGR_PEP_ID=MMETSP1353-20130828/12127_1 /TAXON_ID=1077150 /ORGANISM="Erythrolobus australicus, Strain CCMP3124" /LENGTH=128 /DNA_ID=CAMNT_0028536841 /DNA_START=179 /DNA_END=565 /DNA_ORIENTATION=+